MVRPPSPRRRPHRLWRLLLCLAAAAAACTHAAEPVPIIFDTDMDSDCDDAGALAMLHALADRGEAHILATPVSSKHPWSAACTSAINTYFGRADLPIGEPKGPGAIEQGSRFAEKIAEEFAHRFSPKNPAPDATQIYRQVLAGAGDGSVTIVTVGDLTNIRYLLESKPDQHSPLNGTQLARHKVKRWVCMGSRYPADNDPGRWGNFKPDPKSTVKAIAGWPTFLTFTGGGSFAESLSTGARLAELPEKHPVRRVYELYFKGAPKNRHSADQIATYIAVRGTGKPWRATRGGFNEIFRDGRHAWRDSPNNPRQEYVSALQSGVDPKAVAMEIEELMLHLPQK